MRESQTAIEREIVRALPGGVSISVHVQLRAFRTEPAGIHGHALKIRVAAPPDDGAANDEVCRFFARRCDVPLSAVEILSGAGGRQKRILVKGGLSGRCVSDFNSTQKVIADEVIVDDPPREEEKAQGGRRTMKRPWTSGGWNVLHLKPGKGVHA